ncbi:MAG: SIS domain-containing protein [Gaiellaceae bacterium]
MTEARPATSDPSAPGERMLRDIAQQPAVWRGLTEHLPLYEAVAREARRRTSAAVRLVGHGSSDNAASFAIYAFGLLPGWTAFRDSISLSIYYGAGLDLGGSTVVALSQSGRTQDVVEYVEHTRAHGAFTIALTNDPGSALAQAAEVVLPLAAGREEAIAATRTYTAQVAALALLAGCCSGRGAELATGVRDVADQLESALPVLEQSAAELADRFVRIDRLFAIGRGPDLATARELSLKLLETCRVAAQPLTATDLSHGPVAALDGSFPVWAIASQDASLPAMREAAARARATGAELVVSGSAAAGFVDADHRIPVPAPRLPQLAPLSSVVPGQLFARALATAKGLDPDSPAGITKVTLVP